jgi:hypothetical protein
MHSMTIETIIADIYAILSLVEKFRISHPVVALGMTGRFS